VECDSDPAWNKSSAGAMYCRDHQNKTPIDSDIAPYLVEASDINIAKIYILNHFSDHIRQLGNLSKTSPELPENGMIDLKKAYRQWNGHDAPYQNVRLKVWKDVIQY